MTIKITDDFDLSKIADSGQCFRVKAFEDGTYRFLTGRHILHMRKLSPTLYEVDCSDSLWREVWFPYFDLNRSYRRIRSQIPEDDAYMGHAAKQGAGLRILMQDPWEMLITFIISQQKTIPAIKSCVEQIAKTYGDPVETDFGTVHLFPKAEQMMGAASADLTQLKLGYRTPYIQDAIDKVSSGRLSLERLHSYDDVQLFNALKSVHGVGDKVANCIALFAYNRTSLVPIDTWIKKVIHIIYGGRNPFPDYGNTAGIMQQYLFYYAQHNKHEFQ